MNLIHELKRRNVFKVGAAYLVVSWLLIQVVATLGTMLDLQESVGRTILLLLVIGFPVALVVSWIYEVTPDGITTQQAVDAGAVTTSGRKLNAVIIGGMALAIVFLVVDNYVLTDVEPVQAPPARETQSDDAALTVTAELDKSIAVLPFANLSSDPEQEYFSDGLSEEILNKLAQVDDLLVAARTSSFFYKGRNEDMRTIGEQLGVSYLLEGSVRRSGDSLRITAQLIQADNGFHLWSNTYDRQLADIFEIQDDIATEVTRALSITLSAGEFAIPGQTSNVAAYDALMKGRSVFARYTLQAMREAEELLEESVQLDPDCLPCWEFLALLYEQAGLYPENELQTLNERKEEAIANARRIFPDAQILLAMDATAAMARFDWAEAEHLFQQMTITRDQSGAHKLRRHAQLLTTLGRLEEALPLMERAARLEPRDSFLAWALGAAYLILGRQEEALNEIARGKAIGDSNSLLNTLEWRVFLNSGDLQGLSDSVDQYYATLDSAVTPIAPQPLVRRAVDLMLAGDRETAVAESLEQISTAETPSNREFHFWVLAYFDAVDQYVFAEEDNVPPVVWYDQYQGFRQQPAFRELLESRNVVDYWRTTGKWADKCRPVPDSDTDFECF